MLEKWRHSQKNKNPASDNKIVSNIQILQRRGYLKFEFVFIKRCQCQNNCHVKIRQVLILAIGNRHVVRLYINCIYLKLYNNFNKILPATNQEVAGFHWNVVCSQSVRVVHWCLRFIYTDTQHSRKKHKHTICIGRDRCEQNASRKVN